MLEFGVNFLKDLGVRKMYDCCPLAVQKIQQDGDLRVARLVFKQVRHLELYLLDVLLVEVFLGR